MGKVTEDRLAELRKQLKSAQVKAEDEPNLYTVVVPGAVREVNQVKAKNKTEARNKVKQLLELKTKNFPEEPGEIIEIQSHSPGKPRG